tara:strand:- start:60 stop:494 length:435 start_codon:yes stop_codon:yes gene_type:complete
MHPVSWDWGIQTTVEIIQAKWETTSLPLTWVRIELLRQSLQVMHTLVRFSTTHMSSAGDPIHQGNWDWGIQTTEEIIQAKWEEASLQSTWVREEPLRLSPLVIVTPAPFSTTHKSSAGEIILMVSWAKDIIATEETTQTKWVVT